MLGPKQLISRVVFALLLVAVPSAARGDNEKLRSLRAGLEAFLEKAPGPPEESVRLAVALDRAAYLAGREPDLAERQALRDEISGLLQRLAAAAPGRSAAGPAAAGPATLRGRVVAAVTGSPIAGASLIVTDSSNYYFQAVQGDADGRYLFTDLLPGTYQLEVHTHGQPYGSQLWNGISCPYGNCPRPLGTPIVLPPGADFVADFQLETLGEITGTLRAAESGEPLPNLQVQVFTTQGAVAGVTSADGQGRYRLGGLETGGYFVAVSDSAERPGMVYDGVVCQLTPYDFFLSCPHLGAELVNVDRGQIVSGIDFAIARGAELRGRVIDAVSGLPLANTLLRLQDLDSTRELLTGTDALGAYQLRGLKSGRWRLLADLSGYMTQAYRLRNCLAPEFCPAGFDPIVTLQGQRAEGLDFALERGGTASGRVLDQLTRQPVDGASVTVYSPDGYFLAAAYTDSIGSFSLSELPAGELVFKAEAAGYLAEYYEDVDPRVGIGAARKVRIRSNELTAGIEITPRPLGGATGRAVDAATGVPLASSCLVFARLLDAPPGVSDWNAFCGPDGGFSLTGLWPGQYRLWIVPQDGHAPYLYGRGTCNLDDSYPREPACELAGAVLTVGAGAANLLGDLPLEAGASVYGFVSLGAFPGSLPAHPKVHLHDATGRRLVSSELFLEDQSYGFDNLAPGAYHLVLDGDGAFVSHAWNGPDCSRWYCDPRSGQAIPVAAGEPSGGHFLESSLLAPYAGCSESATALCLEKGRFRVETTWRDFLGQSGPGHAVRVTDETAYFWFFDPGNVELMVKTLNACSRELGLHFWVFAAGLTNVEVEMKVTDTLTGQVRTYRNPSGQVIAPILDIDAFATCAAPEPASTPAATPEIAPETAPEIAPEIAPTAAPEGLGTCTDDGGFLCLAGGRFQVSAAYRRSLVDPSFSAQPRRLTADTAAFTFYDPGNVELIVKVLDACDQALPGYWVFVAGLTDLEIEIVVADTLTGATHHYFSGFGPFQPIFDLGTFAASCDPAGGGPPLWRPQ